MTASYRKHKWFDSLPVAEALDKGIAFALTDESSRRFRQLIDLLQHQAAGVSDILQMTERDVLVVAEYFVQSELDLDPTSGWAIERLIQIRRRLHAGRVYENHCWHCRMGISSLLCSACPDCHYFRCRGCGHCFCEAPPFYLWNQDRYAGMEQVVASGPSDCAILPASTPEGCLRALRRCLSLKG